MLSAVAPSDAAGLLKEELDADGGSGFSFGDLLADRCGHDVRRARDAQTRRRRPRCSSAWPPGFRLDDFFPPGKDLPEDIPDSELRARYGGVGGPLYRKYADEIERRVASAAAYR